MKRDLRRNAYTQSTLAIDTIWKFETRNPKFETIQIPEKKQFSKHAHSEFVFWI
jgi:hypothetical protein